MRTTPEQYRETAVELIQAGTPLVASAGPGEHVQTLTPADGKPGAYVEVQVWVSEERVNEQEFRARGWTARLACRRKRIRRRGEANDLAERLEAMNR
jgi:hypothetical protein